MRKVALQPPCLLARPATPAEIKKRKSEKALYATYAPIEIPLYECEECWALTINPVDHEAWHHAEIH